MSEPILIAVLKVGLPVFIVSLIVLYWINKRSSRQFDELIDSAAKSKKNKSNDKHEPEEESDFLHKKWVQFGGGFYGMVGLLTYMVVEWKELVSLLSDFSKIEFSIGNLISELIVKFLIESIINLITAITWPVYWLGRIEGTSVWLSLLAAYLGYWAAEQLLKQHFNKNH